MRRSVSGSCSAPTQFTGSTDHDSFPPLHLPSSPHSVLPSGMAEFSIHHDVDELMRIFG